MSHSNDSYGGDGPAQTGATVQRYSFQLINLFAFFKPAAVIR
jgi:hypothetical protein